MGWCGGEGRTGWGRGLGEGEGEGGKKGGGEKGRRGRGKREGGVKCRADSSSGNHVHIYKPKHFSNP